MAKDLEAVFKKKEMKAEQEKTCDYPSLEKILKLGRGRVDVSLTSHDLANNLEANKRSMQKLAKQHQPSRPPQPSLNIGLARQYREELSVELSEKNEKEVDRALAVAYGRTPNMVISSKQAQPRCGSSINPEKITKNVGTGSAWATSFFSDIAAEKGAEKEVAADLYMQVVQLLEEHKVRLAVRDLAPRDEELRELNRPRRPGTLSRHCRMFGMFASFLLGDGYARSVTPRTIDGPLVLAWLLDLMNHNVGANTPEAAMGCLRFFSELMGFEFTRTFKIINDKSLECKENKSSTLQRAASSGVDVLRWLEEMVMDTSRAEVDRVVCGRWRLLVQASVRRDDLKTTPIGMCKWVVNGEGELRGLPETKTFPRSWVCSVGSVSSHVDWLPTFMKLMRRAHAAGLDTDDLFGKRALPDRSGYDIGPTDGQADTYDVRYLLLKENVKQMSFGIPERFSCEDILNVRHHGAKCTSTSCAQYPQHKGNCKVSKSALRDQGGWKASRHCEMREDGEDSMPDTSLRSKQLLSLELQEKCLEHIRKYGSLDYESNWIPLSQSELPGPAVGASKCSGWVSAKALLDSFDGLLPPSLKTPARA